MSLDKINNLFSPQRIAIFTNSNIPELAEKRLFQNIISGGFNGSIYPIDPEREAVCSIPAYKNIKEVKKRPDLAIITGNPQELPKLLEQAGKVKIPFAIIFSMDFRHVAQNSDAISRKLISVSKKYNIRFIGPNSLGIIRPGFNINISLAPKAPPKGRIAFVSQSATLASAILDYAASKHVGISTFISLGSQLDVDYGDVIDFLAMDPETRGIILYLESVQNGKKFIGACRAFTKTKPIVLIKGGKVEQSRKITLTRLGSLAGEDSVYDAVFKRSGIVRVGDALELFNTSEALSKQIPPKGNKILIVTNAGGPAVLATDVLIKKGGNLAKLSQETLNALREIIPSYEPIGNPVDCLSNASASRIKNVLEIALKDDAPDALLLILTPQPLTEPVETAKALIELSKKYRYKTFLACWMGSGPMELARNLLNENSIPTFVAPEQAVKSFLYMYEYEENRRLLSETPSNILSDFSPNKEKALSIFYKVIDEQRLFLYEREAKEVFRAYGLNTTKMFLAKNAEEAKRLAVDIGSPVALKVESPHIPYKNKVDGVKLHVLEDQVKDAFILLKKNLHTHKPDAHFNGVTVEPMILDFGYEFMIASKKDPTFGSVILFGLGGQLVKAEKDYCVGLPPLNQTLAKRLMEGTKICKELLKDKDWINPLKTLENALVRFSMLISDFPFIKEIEINSFYLTKKDGICLDGRILLEDDALNGKVDLLQGQCPEHLAICPYPCELIETVRLKGDTDCIIRPIKPEDEPLMKELFYALSEESVKNRFFQLKKEITHDELARYCQVDYDREIALVAEIAEKDKEKIIGVCRLTIMPNKKEAELAIVVGDPWQNLGLGSTLMDKTIDVARQKGIKEIWMDVLSENKPMNNMAKRFKFKAVASSDPDIKRYVLKVR